MVTNTVVIIGVGAILIVVKAVSEYNKFKNSISQKLKGFETKKISDCKADDIVKITGQIKYLGKTFTAPFSGKVCGYYELAVVERQGRAPEKVIIQENGGSILIKEGNSYAFIDLKDIKSSLNSETIFQSGTFKDVPKELEMFLYKHGELPVEMSGFNKTLLFKEGILEEGKLITVAGKVVWKTAAELGLDLPVDKVLFVSGYDQIPVYISNDSIEIKIN